jgi:dienelactone hydrolase
MIGRELPREGAPLAIPGPYDVTSGPAFDAPGYIVFHPAGLDRFPADDSMPVMAWGNGGCAIDGTRYSDFLSTIASHGFLVLTTVRVDGGAGQATADDLRGALDWAETENARNGSPLAGKIAVDRMAVMGQSCGGFLSVALGADPRVDTIAPFNSGVSGTGAGRGNFPTTSALAELHGPVMFINGGEVDFMYETSAANYDAIDHVPVFYGARDNAGHTATVFHPGGGEFANVASNWLKWTLKGDDEAGGMFAGPDCTLCTDPNWETRSKGWE